MFSCITERHESLHAKDELLESYESIYGATVNLKELKMKCEEFLETEISSRSPMFAAVMNSIDWEWLNGELCEWLEDAEKGSESDSESEAEAEAKYQQTKAEIVAKMNEMKRLIAEKNDDEMDALTDPKNH